MSNLVKIEGDENLTRQPQSTSDQESPNNPSTVTSPISLLPHSDAFTGDYGYFTYSKRKLFSTNDPDPKRARSNDPVPPELSPVHPHVNVEDETTDEVNPNKEIPQQIREPEDDSQSVELNIEEIVPGEIVSSDSDAEFKAELAKARKRMERYKVTNRKFTCSECGWLFWTRERERKHRMEHFYPGSQNPNQQLHKIKQRNRDGLGDQVSCRLCRQRFYSLIGFEGHLNAVHAGEEGLSIAKLKQTISSATTLGDASWENATVPRSCINPETRQFRCPLCFKEFPVAGEQYFLDHFRDLHPDLKDNVMCPDPECDWSFSDPHSLYMHHRRVHCDFWHQCFKCNVTHKSEEHLENHQKKYHKLIVCSCRKCRVGFVSIEGFRTHWEKIHEDSKTNRSGVDYDLEEISASD